MTFRMHTLWLLLLCFLFFSTIEGADRRTSYPYITGDTFRAFADEIFDETNQFLTPSKIKPYSIIFVKVDLLGQFFNRYHNVLPPYILLTHNGDLAIPGKFRSYLNDQRLIAWFGINIENCTHNKLHPIPIGLTNRYNQRGGNLGLIEKLKKKIGTFEKRHLLYMNFQTSSYPVERNSIFNSFKNKNYCYVSGEAPYKTFYKDICESKFVFSPRGNGLDTHRTWETLYLGSIPIVKSSLIDPLFIDLPVLIVENWDMIDKAFLERKYREITAKEYNLRKLDAVYWFQLIRSYQNGSSRKLKS